MKYFKFRLWSSFSEVQMPPSLQKSTKKTSFQAKSQKGNLKEQSCIKSEEMSILKHYKVGLYKEKIKAMTLYRYFNVYQCHLHSRGWLKLKFSGERAILSFKKNQDCVQGYVVHWVSARRIGAVRCIGHFHIVYFSSSAVHPQDAVHWACAWRTEPPRQKFHLRSIKIQFDSAHFSPRKSNHACSVILVMCGVV